jgi:iron complex transport system substrate-binding protein
MKRTIALILTLFSIVMMITSCQPADSTTIVTTTATTATTAETTESTAAPAFPVTVKNAAGNDVKIDTEPQAIVITNVWAAEILLDLIDSSRIKGLSAWGDNEAVSAVADKASSVEARVTTGKPEGIVALKPDMVIIDSFSDFDGSLSKTLTEAGITVLMMDSPTNFDQIKAAITTLAAAVGESAKGEAMVSEIDSKLQAVAAKTASLTADQKLSVMFYDAYLDMNGNDTGMLCAYGDGSPFDAIAAAAGLVNVCDAVTYSQVSKEKVVAEWKPDILVVSGLVFNADFSVQDDQGAKMIAAIKASDLLTTLPAVQNGQVFALTAQYAGSTSQYMADAVYELAAAAYPELFK